MYMELNSIFVLSMKSFEFRLSFVRVDIERFKILNIEFKHPPKKPPKSNLQCQNQN